MIILIRKHPFARLALVALLCAAMMYGCTSVSQEDTNDPYESINRGIFKFNRGLDKHVVKPIAKTYGRVVPDKIQKSVSNFFSNLNLLPTIANDIMQANLTGGLSGIARFCVNSTLGILGLFDVVETFHLNLPKHHQDLGLTLAKYGAHESPYIMMPVFGPKTVREIVSMPISMTTLAPLSYLDNSTVSYGLQSLEVVNYRAFLLATDKLVNESFDPYVFVRNAYLQDRNRQVNQLAEKTARLKPEPDDSDDVIEELDDDLQMEKIDEAEDAFLDQLENDSFIYSYQHYRNHYHPASTFHLKHHRVSESKPAKPQHSVE